MGARANRDSSSGEESDTLGPEDRSWASNIPTTRQAGSRLPPFTGSERWEIWFNRFSDVARLNKWDTQTKLQELLPRLQGVAGEFVYGQLSFEKRTNYRKLIAELDSRFRIVETTKTYQAQFSNRVQKAGESPETYAAELKRLYDKAYVNRNAETRQEDLTRKFLDGIIDERTRFHVEYIKEPDNSDVAVNEYVKFQETRRRPSNKESRDSWNKHSTRAVKMTRPVSDEEDSDEEFPLTQEGRVARIPSKSGKKQIITQSTAVTQQKPITSIVPSPEFELGDNKPVNNSEMQISDVLKDISTTMANQAKEIASVMSNQAKEMSVMMSNQTKEMSNMARLLMGSQGEPSRSQQPSHSMGQRNVRPHQGPRNDRGYNNQSHLARDWSTVTCYKCGEVGHISRTCPSNTNANQFPRRLSNMSPNPTPTNLGANTCPVRTQSTN
jgi:hypothetical protein